MPVPSRTTLYARLNAYRDALRETVIVSKAPSETEHNAKATLFRNGLAILGFAMLEDFIRTRTSEVLQRVGHGVTPFADLPDALRLATTIGVVDGIKFSSSFIERGSPDFYSFVQNHSQSVASTSAAGYRLSELAFASDHPNVQTADIESILLAFHVERPWQTIETFANRAGTGVFGTKAAFQNALWRRNMAAHRANSNVEFSELDAFAGIASTIAAGFDMLLSHALRKILDADPEHLRGSRMLAHGHIGIRYISKSDRYWRETVGSSAKAFKRDLDRTTLVTDCIARAAAKGQAVITKDETGKISEWFTPVVD